MSEDPKIIDFDHIKAIIPHRYPCLMVDRVKIFKSENKAVGIKNITINEPFFQGHFPGNPVVPGIIILESMVQTGGLITKEFVSAETDFAFLMSIHKAKFRKPVFPGDRMVINAELVRLRNGIAKIRATVNVNTQQACQAEFIIGITKNISETLRPVEFAPELMLDGQTIDAKPLTDIHGIMNIIPHRYPFLLVDAILSLKEPRILGLKNVTGNDPFLQGHFAKHTVMPGTFLVEATAQVGSVYILNQPENKNKLGYLMSIDHTRFLRPVVPGDQLIIEVKMLNSRPRVGKASGRIHVGNEIVAETLITFVIVDRQDKQ